MWETVLMDAIAEEFESPVLCGIPIGDQPKAVAEARAALA